MWILEKKIQNLQVRGHFWKGVGNGMRGVFGDVFIFHLIQYTCYNSKRRFSYRALTCKQHMHCKCVCESEMSVAAWTTKMWMCNRVGAVDRRALLLMASYIPTLKQRRTKRTVNDINRHEKCEVKLCYNWEKKKAQRKQKYVSWCGKSHKMHTLPDFFALDTKHFIYTCLTPAVQTGSTPRKPEHFPISIHPLIILTVWKKKHK